MYQIEEEDEDESQDNDGINDTKGREAFNEDGEAFVIQHDNASLEEQEDGGISKTEGNLPIKDMGSSPKMKNFETPANKDSLAFSGKKSRRASMMPSSPSPIIAKTQKKNVTQLFQLNKNQRRMSVKISTKRQSRLELEKNTGGNNQGDNLVPQESKVGKMLSDLTTRRVIILVLAMLISVPLFSDTTYQDDNTSFETGINLLKRYKPHTPQFDNLFETILQTELKNPNPLIYMSALDYVWEA